MDALLAPPTSWHSYPSIFAIGHRAAAQLFDDPVTIEEKVDGSQFSFGIFGGVLKCRSKGQQLIVEAPEKMFAAAVDSVKERAHLLADGWTYRGEFLGKPKHNTVGYERIPRGHVVIFDVNTGEEAYLPYAQKEAEAARIGLECVPLVYEGMVPDAEFLRGLIDRDSFLGGAKAEGIVVKNYAKFGPDKKALLGKYVTEAFKEAHTKEWKKTSPQGKDILQTIIEGLKTGARWEKSIQHLREAGNLDGSPKDIGNLIKEVQADVFKEETEAIEEALLRWARPAITRGIVAGLPEWYKQRLMDSQFAE